MTRPWDRALNVELKTSNLKPGTFREPLPDEDEFFIRKILVENESCLLSLWDHIESILKPETDPSLFATAEDRRHQILRLLEHEGNVKVENLAERFAVSQVTIRKDLAELEEQGLLQRTYGGAVFSHRSRFNISFIERVQLKAGQKEGIARAAIEHIHEGDTIILDGGP